MTWLRGDLQLGSFISLIKPRLNGSQNVRTKLNQPCMVPSSWPLAKQLNKLLTYILLYAWWVSLLMGLHGYSAITNQSLQAQPFPIQL